MGENTETIELAYIYGLSSSSNIENIRYIGYTRNPDKRIKEHLNQSKQLLYRRHKWIQKEVKLGNFIEMTIIRCVPLNIVSQCEIETVLLYKSFGADLVNGNNGGIGGKSPSKEVRVKLSKSKIGNTWNKGRKQSENNKKALDIARKKPRTEKAKKNMSLAQKGKISKRRLLNEFEIKNLYDLYNYGYSFSDIIEITGVKKTTLTNIFYGKHYSEIKNKYNLLLKRPPYTGKNSLNGYTKKKLII